jgi:hypothetical protein
MFLGTVCGLIYRMRYPANENDVDDPLPFVTLAAITANVIEHLKIRETHEKYGQRQTAHQRRQKDQTERHVDRVQRPLRKMAAT